MDKGKEEEKMNLDEEIDVDTEISVDEKIVSVYLDRLEELEDGSEEAVLLIDDGGEEYSAQINLPAKFLPADVSDGDYLTLKISYDEAKTNAALESARQLLND